MPQIDPNLIPIQEAATEYGRSRKWLDEQVRAGHLHYAKIEGDKRTFLLRSELDQLLKPQIRKFGEDADDEVG